MFPVAVLFNSTARSPRTASVNAAFFPVMLYIPTGKLLNVYEPFASVVVWFLTPVALFTAVTSAPGTTAPVESVTTPTILPSIVWPKAHGAKPVSTAAHMHSKNTVINCDLTLDIQSPSLSCVHTDFGHTYP